MIDVFGDPTILIIVGVVIGGLVAFVVAYVIFKGRKDTSIFEFETFEDTVLTNLQKTFRIEGHKSKAKILHGINNKVGNVEKWLRHTGTWEVLRYDPKNDKYDPEISVNKEYAKDKEGNVILDSKGKPVSTHRQIIKKIDYDLMIFKVSGDGVFESSSYLIVDYELVTYDPKSNSYLIREEAQLRPFGGAWITSPKGETYTTDISFRRSIEQNNTYIQNFTRKTVFIETEHAKRMSVISGKAAAKTIGYQAHATNTLVREITDTDEDET